MIFERRELQAFAEPMSAAQLEEGRVYFSLTFIDDEMLVPVLEPLVFIGRLSAEDSRRLLFQDIDSYRRGVRHGQALTCDEAAFYESSESEVNHIFDFEPALDELLRCSLRRQATHGPLR